MRIVVVGGSSSGVGKTTLAAALVHDWARGSRTAAMKVSVKDDACETVVLCFEHPGSAGHRHDSERLLEAGACAVVWVTVSRANVRAGLARGLRALRAVAPEVAVIESTSAGIQMRRVDESWFIGGTAEWKPWAERHRVRAGRVLDSDAALALAARLLEGRSEPIA